MLISILGLAWGERSVLVSGLLNFPIAVIIFIYWKKLNKFDFKGAMISMFVLSNLFGVLLGVLSVLTNHDKRITNSCGATMGITFVYAIVLLILHVRKKARVHQP